MRIVKASQTKCFLSFHGTHLASRDIYDDVDPLTYYLMSKLGEYNYKEQNKDSCTTRYLVSNRI